MKRHTAQAAIKQNGVASASGDKDEAKTEEATGGSEAEVGVADEAKPNLEKGGCFDELE